MTTEAMTFERFSEMVLVGFKDDRASALSDIEWFEKDSSQNLKMCLRAVKGGMFSDSRVARSLGRLERAMVAEAWFNVIRESGYESGLIEPLQRKTFNEPALDILEAKLTTMHTNLSMEFRERWLDTLEAKAVHQAITKAIHDVRLIRTLYDGVRR